MPPYSQNEIQMSPGDLIEFTICLANMNGNVDLHTLTWEKPELIEICQNERDALSYNRDIKLLSALDRKVKVQCNTNRLCEVEDAVVDWIPVSQIDVPKIQVTIKNFVSSVS